MAMGMLLNRSCMRQAVMQLVTGGSGESAEGLNIHQDAMVLSPKI